MEETQEMEFESREFVWVDPNPVEILEHIFRYVDDRELMRLKDITERFESIVKTTLKERYKSKNFVVCEAERAHCERFIALMANNTLGIEANGLDDIDQNHWMIRLLNQHAIKLDRLIVDNCSFKNLAAALEQHMNVTQIAFRSYCDYECDRELPEFRNLTDLEIDRCEFSNYSKIIQNNPRLQRLKIGNVSSASVIECIGQHCNQLKELQMMNYSEALVGSLDVSSVATGRLHTLGITIADDSIDVLKAFNAECKNLKRLTLQQNGGSLSEETVQAIGSFSSIEALSLKVTRETIQKHHLLAESLGNLPNLTHLRLEVHEVRSMNDFLLSLVRKCKRINRIDIRAYCSPKNQMGINKDFHDEFRDIIRHRPQEVSIKIRFISPRFDIKISRTEIISNKTLVHWVGYDPACNQSNAHLLQLADAQIPSAKDQWKQQPFQKILSYLDPNSLYALQQTSARCRQLVHAHLKKRFVDEAELFVINENEIDRNVICSFGKYLTNVEFMLYQRNVTFWDLINMHCGRSVLSLTIRDMSFSTVNNTIFCGYFNFPNLRHLKYLSTRKILLNIDNLRGCHRLETLEFGNDSEFVSFGIASIGFIHLKKITFYRRSASAEHFVEMLEQYTPNAKYEIAYATNMDATSAIDRSNCFYY